MNKMKIYDILELCLDDIKTGRRTMEECLMAYPAARRELEPLLKTALLIDKPCAAVPSTAFKTRARVGLMEYINSSEQKKAAHFAPSLWFKRVPRAAGIALAVVLALSVSSGGAAYAAQGSVPGDALYGVKLASEQAGTVLTFGSDARADRYLSLTERRVDEMTALTDMGRTEQMENAARNYENALKTILFEAEKDSRAEVMERVSLATSKHLEKLDEISGRVPEKAKGAVAHAREASLKGQQTALRALAKHNPNRAMEISLASMAGMVERASASGVMQDGAGVESALFEYGEMQALGNEISAIAHGLGQDTTTVEQLVAEATAKHVETLAGVYEKVPEQAKPAIEKAMTNAAEEHGKAADSLKDKGAPDNSPATPSMPTSVPEDVKDKVKDAFKGKDKDKK